MSWHDQQGHVGRQADQDLSLRAEQRISLQHWLLQGRGQYQPGSAADYQAFAWYAKEQALTGTSTLTMKKDGLLRPFFLFTLLLYYFLAAVFLAAGFLAVALGAVFLATGAATFSSNHELLLALALCPGLRVGSIA